MLNVIEDSLERASLKNRQPEDYNRLITECNAWNQATPAEAIESGAYSF